MPSTTHKTRTVERSRTKTPAVEDKHGRAATPAITSSSVVCWKCGEPGHIAPNCPHEAIKEIDASNGNTSDSESGKEQA